MPRQPRIDIPGLLQHVIFRGIERRNIFLDDEDRENFVERLKTLLDETETRCLAWVLLNNHVHLLLLPTKEPLAHFMRRLLTGYAVCFNLRHQRSGHLFQNRYKSIVCDQNAYLLKLVRYIHLNPIRAGAVDGLSTLAEYPWGGHRQLLGKSGPSVIQCTDDVLALFSRRRGAARAAYLAFLEDGLDEAKKTKLSCGGRKATLAIDDNLQQDDVFDERILGGGAFVQQVIVGAETGNRDEKRLDQLFAVVTRHCGVEMEDIFLPSKQADIVLAKTIVCYVATRLLRVKGIEVANRLQLSTSAVSKAAIRGQKLFAESGDLKRIIEVDISTTSP